MRSELDKFEIQVVAVSTDTPKQIQAAKHKHGLTGTLISDRDLKITRALNLENLNPMAKPPGLVGLPIPTTILIDAKCHVVWLDQSKDYVDRSDASRVLHAIETSLG